MTAFAFILGCVPLWIATGSGACRGVFMGTAVIGGMLAASLIAVLMIPVTFDVVESLTERFRSHSKPKHAPEIAGEGKEPRDACPPRVTSAAGSDWLHCGTELSSS